MEGRIARRARQAAELGLSDPRVSADLIALLRYGLTPNEPGRPLVEVEKPFWRVPTSVNSNAAQ
jgi:hypothetical protein